MTPAANTFNTPNTLAVDTQGLESLRLKAKTNPGESVAAASKQFESLFLGMMLKSMRSATPQDGPFDSEQTKLYTSLLDQQLAQHMAKRGTGLAEVMTRQLSANFTDSSKSSALFSDALAATPPVNRAAVPVPAPAPAPASAASQQPGDFVNRVWSHAVDAAQALGVQPQFIVGQAALESGWGKYEIRTAEGQPSHNLFGIKAAGNWKGPSVEKSTIEYVNGVAVKTVDKFRVYASYSDAFRDYANLLKDNARYAGVIGQGDAKGFAQGLQRGGYATDPAYAEKLVGVINNARELAVPKALPDLSTGVAVAQRGTPGAMAVAAAFSPDNAYAGGLIRAAYGASNSGAHFPATRSDIVMPALPVAVRERPAPTPISVRAATEPQASRASAPVSSTAAIQQPGDFVKRVWSHAVDAAQELGVQPQFIVGQAALESGWGRYEIRKADGQPSHNLFGIKAGADWKGATVDKTATAYVNGVATKVVEKFRVYASYDESFRDYASLLRDNARYSAAVGQGDARGFARGLQRGGYATDPAYADKLVSVINSPPIRQALAVDQRPQVVALR
ncbi:MAG: flagellar assembly peptidoglycan hydrolase FlgJ [Burkholderiales bacterium]